MKVFIYLLMLLLFMAFFCEDNVATTNSRRRRPRNKKLPPSVVNDNTVVSHQIDLSVSHEGNVATAHIPQEKNHHPSLQYMQQQDNIDNNSASTAEESTPLPQPSDVEVETSYQLEEGGPLFIIAGTQKSGTTALAAFMSLHPNISLSARKELHFFDKDANYQKGIQEYLSNFQGNKSTIIYGEATPFYIASRVACNRISQHFPNVKMIILLREPVDRAYSEYQMKARRVREHEELIDLLTKHKEEVIRCLQLHPSKYKSLQNCLPPSITTHGRFSKFTKALKKSMAKWDDWTKVVDSCFPPKIISFSNKRHQELSQRLTDVIYLNRSSALVQPKTEVSSNSRLFHSSGCWQNYKEGFETLQPLHIAFFKEIEEFLQCSSTSNSSSMVEETDASLLWNLKRLDENIDRCIKVKGGISKQYIYRSLYAPQLFNCFKYIDQDQFLVLDSAALRNDLPGTMQKVLEFLGLPIDLSWLPNERDEEVVLVNVVKSKFAAFEKTTSWRLQSIYDPLKIETKMKLRSFFAEYNNLLFELISQNFSDQWNGS